MAEYFAASDILLYPSLADNCPLVVLEAMACGTPVIAFNTGGVPELVDHMKMGYVVEYKNLADGVELFLNDDALREKAGILAREKVENKFTLDQQVDNYLKLYARILEVSFFEFFKGGPQIYDYITFMKERGFVAYDVFDLQYRLLDGAMSQ